MAFTSAQSRRLWMAARKTESRYGVALRKLAATIGHVVAVFPTSSRADLDKLAEFLKQYAKTIEPWANAVTSRMLREVNLKDAKSWEQHSREMGRVLVREVRNAPTGMVMRQLHNEQVELIKSLPLEAAEKVQALAQESLITGQRYDELRRKVWNLGDVTRARATLIARTEVSKASSTLTQARAEFVGSEGYIWRTVGDSDVRKSHRKMNGKFVRWADAPEVEPGKRYHAGCFPNCRCWPEPVLPEEF